VALADLVAVACTRWRIGEDFHTAKDLAGLDHGQFTCWNSWMRWTLISLIATAVLALTRALTRQAGQSIPGLVPISARELLRILRATVLSQPRQDLGHLLHWSAWRRRHQYRATLCHRRWNNITAAAAP
jgi:hypothetical protein